MGPRPVGQDGCHPAGDGQFVFRPDQSVKHQVFKIVDLGPENAPWEVLCHNEILKMTQDRPGDRHRKGWWSHKLPVVFIIKIEGIVIRHRSRIIGGRPPRDMGVIFL